MPAHDAHLIELLLTKKLVSPERVQQAQQEVPKNKRIADYLIEKKFLSEEKLLEALAGDYGMAFSKTIGKISKETISLLPKLTWVKYCVVPLGETPKEVLLAVSDPLDFESVNTIRYLLKKKVTPVLCPKKEIQDALENYFHPQEIAPKKSQKSVEEEDSDAPIIQLVHSTILDAHGVRASDIHLEPLKEHLRFRYRIDGVLEEKARLSKKLQASVVNRIKIMANMDIAEKRLPQDGRITLNLGSGKQIDLRVSTVPTIHGESVVMRLLDKESLALEFEELGFFADDQSTLKSTIESPDGIFLVCGPTGCGKSTTLYACLNFLNQPDRKMITVEDPIEYRLHGVNQVQVLPEAGVTFGTTLRAMLRQSPDTIMVGEIRDAETASIAMNASLTGHLVLSTLHTNDAPSAVVRLLNMGLKPFLVASSLRAVMAQRLVRKVCTACKKKYDPTRAEKHLLGLNSFQKNEAHFYMGRGCEECHRTGYRGRTGIFEMLVIGDMMKGLIHEQASYQKLFEEAKKQGMRTLREDGARKVAAGITTPKEVLGVTVRDSEEVFS